MYAKLKLQLDTEEINFQQSSNLQGIIMENIDSQYASYLHGNQLNPYSQYVIKKDGISQWHIQTITTEAYENIILPLVNLKKIEIKKKALEVKISARELQTYEEKGLIREFYDVKCPKYLEINFLTPTAFKRDGKYVAYPDLRLVYGSLMRKFSEASNEIDMVDENILQELTDKSEIIRYRLRTIPFPLEQIKITGFIGNVCIRINGPETLARYVRMLIKFGEFSGVGIKTGIGMGAMQFYRREKDD